MRLAACRPNVKVSVERKGDGGIGCYIKSNGSGKYEVKAGNIKESREKTVPLDFMKVLGLGF